MGEVVSINPAVRGAEWVIDELTDRVSKGDRVLGFSFPMEKNPEGYSSIIAPDEVALSNLLLARAILDELIHDMMSSGRKNE